MLKKVGQERPTYQNMNLQQDGHSSPSLKAVLARLFRHTRGAGSHGDAALWAVR